MVASADRQQDDKCAAAIGAQCLEGYAGTGMAACSRCCKVDDTGSKQGNCPGPARNWYLQSADNQCLPCPNSPPTVLIAVTVVAAAVLGPVLLRIGDAMKHAGHLQGPAMSLVNFFQCADLFKHLDLHWPPRFLYYVRAVASLFNFRLPDLPFVVHPECAFMLTYFQKWVLMMLSPFLLFLLMFAFVSVRYSLALMVRRTSSRATSRRASLLIR